MTDEKFQNMYNNNEDEYSQIKYSLHRKQKERKLRKQRKKINHLKSFVRFILFFSLVFVIYSFFMLSGWYLPPDALKNPALDRVEIINNKIIPTYVIENLLKDVKLPKLPIFMIRVQPIKKELYKIPVMKNVYVRRYGFPARIQIIIRERVPIAVIRNDLNSKINAFFTSDGVLVTNKQYMNLINFSNVLNILMNSNNLQKEITPEKIQDVQDIVKEVEKFSNQRVEYIDLRNPNDVFVKIKTVNIRLGALDSTVFERIERIYTILPQIEEINAKVKYIDLSWDKVNYLKLKE